MEHASYMERRAKIETYFDRTAAKAWETLTSNAPVGRIRRTVREGRDMMRNTLLSWLPENMQGLRLLDAGCGTGALAMLAAQRGAEVVAIDLSPTLVQLAKDRLVQELAYPAQGKVTFLSGDMLDAQLGEFDHVVAMDSLIHYDTHDIAQAVNNLAKRTRRSIVFTFAPRTPLLAAMHRVGRLFPQSDRSPALEPVDQQALLHAMQAQSALHDWQAACTARISRGFYTSQAWEWRK